MAVNLRLTEETAHALRSAARRTGRSQQDLLRDAVDRYLGLGPEQSDLDRAVAGGLVRPPTPFRDVRASIRLDGRTSTELLERDDR